MKSQSIQLLAVAAFSLSIVVSAYSQATTGQLTGFVVNRATQEALPGANVQLVGTPIGAATDPEGRFRLAEVPVGTYQVRASFVGFEALVLSDIVVTSGRPTDIVIRMEEASIDIEGVEVTGNYFVRTPDAVVSVERLSYEEIRRSAGGFEDVIRAVSILPGVAQAQSGRNDLVVRGGAPSENLYIVDNIEIPNINHFGTQGASGGPLSYINLDYVRETSFSSGGFGVRYGDRLSSVLTIDMKDARTDHFGGKATIAATQFGLNIEGPLGPDGGVVFSARRSYLDFIFKAAAFSFVPEYWDFLTRANYRIDQSNTLSILGIGAIDRVNFNNATADDRYNNSTILGSDQNQYAFGVSLQHLINKGYLTLTLSRSFVSYNELQRDSLLNPVFSNTSREGETGLRFDAVWKWGKTELSTGMQAKRVKFNTTLYLPPFVTTYGDTISASVDDAEDIGTKGGAFLQVAQTLPLNALLTVGGRMDYFTLINTKFYFSPRASLSLPVGPLTSVQVSVGQYRQFPSYIWLVSNGANRDLLAPRVNQYVLGVEHMLRSDLKLRLEGFRKEYREYPASVDRTYLTMSNTGAGFGGSEDGFSSYGLDRLVNGGSGNSCGVEFFAQKKLSEVPLYGLVSVTLSETRFTALDGIKRPGNFDQALLFNLSLGYKFDERWESNIKYRYAGGRPYTPYESDGTQNPDALNSGRLQGTGILDVRVDRRWNFANWNLIVYIDIQNILNNKYTGQYRWDARTQQVEDMNNGIGILPSIGISAEF